MIQAIETPAPGVTRQTAETPLSTTINIDNARKLFNNEQASSHSERPQVIIDLERAMWNATNTNPNLNPMSFKQIEDNIANGRVFVALAGEERNEIAGYITCETLPGKIVLLKGLHVERKYRTGLKQLMSDETDEANIEIMVKNSLGYKLFETAMANFPNSSFVFETANKALEIYARIANFKKINSWKLPAILLGIHEFRRAKLEYLLGFFSNSYENYAIFYLDRNHNYEFEV